MRLQMESQVTPANTVRVVAAHQLKTRDVAIYTQTLAEATTLRETPEWEQMLNCRIVTAKVDSFIA